MKKYLIIVMISCLFILVILMLINNSMQQQTKINKGIKEFGTDCCQGHGFGFAGDAFTAWKCEICGYEGTRPDTDVPEICSECAEITGRCQKCGKIIQYK